MNEYERHATNLVLDLISQLFESGNYPDRVNEAVRALEAGLIEGGRG